ncbi:MAG: LacI family transcriptional regulator [Lactobacillus sp.]|nr:LacI family transcriptional regulator [Lactobacillus sp.]
MSITVKDVAKKAGVATSTVSRVINDHPSISLETKKKVWKVMDELGYIPNLTARNLGKQISSAIGIILPPLDSKERIGNPFHLEIIQAISVEANAHDMSIVVVSAKDFQTALDNVTRMHRQKQVDGFVLTYSDSHDPIVDFLLDHNIPFTLVGQPYTQEGQIEYVDNDNQLAGKQACEYLISCGHRSILFATNTIHENLYFERFFGYQKALMIQNLPLFSAVTFESPEDYVNFEKVLKNTQATAIIVIDDLFAVRMIQLANLYGYKVPDDLSIVSFNNSIFATLTHPYLTSIDIDVESLGKIATLRLLKQLNKQEQDGARMLVGHKLIQRESVRNIIGD